LLNSTINENDVNPLDLLDINLINKKKIFSNANEHVENNADNVNNKINDNNNNDNDNVDMDIDINDNVDVDVDMNDK